MYWKLHSTHPELLKLNITVEIDRAANQPGDRAVDVAVRRPHPSDQRLNAVNHIESKAFRVSNTDKDIKPSQFARDVGMPGGVIGGLGGAAIGEKLATGTFDTIKGWFS